MYVLEQAAPFIKAHRLSAGDAVGVCTNGSGSLTILANTPEVWLCSCRLCVQGSRTSCLLQPPSSRALRVRPVFEAPSRSSA